MILLYIRYFWRFSHVVTSLYFWLISLVRRPNLVIASLSNKHGGGYENFTLQKVNMICFKLYRTYSDRTLSIRQMLANLFWVFIVKDCIEVQEKKKKIVVLCSRSPQNVDLGRIFTSQSCSDGKKMYKKAWCTCKVVFCQSNPISIAFLPFSLPLLSSSSLLKVPIVYKRVCFVKEVNKATTFFERK